MGLLKSKSIRSDTTGIDLSHCGSTVWVVSVLLKENETFKRWHELLECVSDWL